MKHILIQVSEGETQVAVLENDQLVELYVERGAEQRLVGNIYNGRVENVLPGMQAAFVNIGLDKNAFLYVEDVGPARGGRSGSIGSMLREGQEILVQVVKEPIGTKGARVTTHVTLPGRYLVLMPNMDYIGISRRIENEKERERLRRLAEAVKPSNVGLIIRTVAEGISEGMLEQEVRGLTRLWKKISSRSKNSGAPSLVHRDLELVQRILRDLYSENVDRLTVNARWVYDKVLDFIECLENSAVLRKRVFLETGDLFDRYGLDLEIEKALRRKVWLRSGGYLVIDQTEALTAIDVNTGKYVGSTNLADTVLRTNLEAAVEIARQVRLRNIGGIIIIDFIDMENHQDQARVVAALEEELKKDKTRAKIMGLTQLGLVEMTRKKVQQGLDSLLQKPCPYCEGRGKVLSEETVGLRVQKKIMSIARQSDAPALLIEVNPAVASLLIGSGGSHLKHLEDRSGKKLIIKGDESFHLEHVRTRSLYTQQEIEEHSSPVKVGQVLQVRIEEPHIVNGFDGIARLNGFVLDVEGAGAAVGETVTVEVSKVFRTYAKARILGSAATA
ncbi:MAG: Rne/Rng family ribonuclease [Syntrophomonadaceae bacterium]|nr:Rne/Rng family ribonuclease [Syntrophomonadaceae bacterium]